MHDLTAWFRERPKWLQNAAGLLLSKRRLLEDEISTLVEECLQEVDAKGTDTRVDFSTEAFSAQNTSILRLCTIGNLRGINALAPRNPLDFGPSNMSIVYGGNGSGKSGYVRILKHICGARNPGALHPNVYADERAPQSVEIAYRIDDRECRITWDPDNGIHTDLRSIDIFDSDCGRMYLESESEVTYEPPTLIFFSDLIAVCEQVAQRIDGKLAKCVSKKPQIPAEYIGTTAGKWYTGLKSTTASEEIEANTKWTKEADKYVADLEARLTEKSPADKARELLAKKQCVEDLIRRIETQLSKLSDESCHRILKLKEKKLLTRNVAQAAATKLFAEAPLEGIGTDAWKLLWEHARRYSKGLAYRDQPFPNVATEARCVLCHQPLSDDARKRLTEFEMFVTGQAEKEARDAEKLLDEAMADIEDIPTCQAIKTQCDAGGLTYEGDVHPIASVAERLQQRKTRLMEVESVEELPKSPDCTAWLQEARKQASCYAEATIKYQEDAKSDTRPQLQAQLRELKAKKWLSEQRDAIRTEIERLKAVDSLERAKRLTNTGVLSRKKGEIAEALITDAFVQRFRDELDALRASRIKVALTKKRVDRGRVLHELQLAKARTGTLREVLSEGEHRIVSLAAFLADVTGKQQPTPFVFDDPISSLDQDFEEAVVQRLVRLSVDRQVIVFTHRVSLLVLLRDYSKREGREPNVTCVRCESWGTGEPGDTPLFTNKISNVLNALLGERFAAARKAHDKDGQAAYAPLAKSICSDFRILLERVNLPRLVPIES